MSSCSSGVGKHEEASSLNSVKAQQQLRPSVHSARTFATFLRKTVAFDYDPYPSPEAMRRDVDFAGLGTVDAVTGATFTGGPEPLGALVVSLRIKEVWSEQSDVTAGDVINIVLHRPTNVPAETYSKSLPIATPIALFGNALEESLDEGVPKGPRYVATPQGFILETPGSIINVWGDETNDNLAGWSTSHNLAGLKSSLMLD